MPHAVVWPSWLLCVGRHGRCALERRTTNKLFSSLQKIQYIQHGGIARLLPRASPTASTCAPPGESYVIPCAPILSWASSIRSNTPRYGATLPTKTIAVNIVPSGPFGFAAQSLTALAHSFYSKNLGQGGNATPVGCLRHDNQSAARPTLFRSRFQRSNALWGSKDTP